jgi:tryptophan synthase alpha chain
VGLADVLDVVAATRPTLRRLRIALFADWSYTVKHRSLDDVLLRVAAADVDGFLLHGLPPRQSDTYYAAARQAGLPIVTTCYATSPPAVVADAAAHAGAYLYLVAQYGRSGTTQAPDEARLAGTIATLRTLTPAPIAVGFGIRTADDVARVHRLGADAAIVGTAVVAEVEQARSTPGSDVAQALVKLVRSLRPTRQPAVTGAGPPFTGHGSVHDLEAAR